MLLRRGLLALSLARRFAHSVGRGRAERLLACAAKHAALSVLLRHRRIFCRCLPLRGNPAFLATSTGRVVLSVSWHLLEWLNV